MMPDVIAQNCWYPILDAKNGPGMIQCLWLSSQICICLHCKAAINPFLAMAAVILAAYFIEHVRVH